MRELKFRAWNTHTNKMYILGNLFELTDCRDEKTHGTHYDEYQTRFMQYTGLKDKDGKEIYEGDILNHNEKFFEVKFSKNQFNLLLKEVKSATNWRGLEWCNNVSKYILVVGNIYENSEQIQK